MDQLVLPLFCVVIPLATFYGLLMLRSRQESARDVALNDAHGAYRSALTALKHVPADPDLRQRALILGRAYANLTRNRTGVTVYDEMAVLNDLSAATAGATLATPYVPTQPSVADRLKQLDALHAAGMVSDQEHADRRRAILGEL